MSTTFIDETIRQAKARLSEMLVQEVSLVDAAANLRRFVIVKGLGSMDIKKGMKLPAAARKSIMDAVAKELDKLTKFVEAMVTSEVDDKASVPDDIGKYLSGVSLSLGGLAKQYGGDVQTPQAVDPAEKRGAKISGKRLDALKAAHGELARVIGEADPEFAKKFPSKDDEEEEGAAPAKKDVEKVAKAAVEPIEKKIEELLAIAKKQGDDLAAANAEILKIKGGTPPPGSRQPDAPTGGSDGDKVTWGSDLAREVAAKRQK